MQNYLLTLAYDGTNYCGFQVQPNGRSVAQTFQDGLEAVLGCRPDIKGCSRTDAGVHARAQIANVRLRTEPDCAAVLEYCWTHLPRDIAVTAVEPAPERFHARLNARAKRYVYRIWNSPIPNVFERKFLCPQTEPLDVEAMRRAADHLCGTHDFRSFCGLRRFKKSTVRTVTAIEIERLGPEVRFRFTGNGFLNQMVRILTGTLVEGEDDLSYERGATKRADKVGLGLRTPEEMPAVLNACDRSAAGRTMPPEGLILDAVFY